MSIRGSALGLIHWRCRSPLKVSGAHENVIRLMAAMYTDTTSYVFVNRTGGGHFLIDSGVIQGCKMAPDFFDAAIDWVMERTTNRS